MKIGTVRVLLVAACAALFLGLMCVPASAQSLEDTWTADSLKSSTNPAARDERISTWRYFWGNSVHPDLSMSNVPADKDLVTEGFFYTFNLVGAGQPLVIPNPLNPGTTEHSSIASGTVTNRTFDAVAAATGRGYVVQPGTHMSPEGLWAVGIRLYNQERTEDASTTDFWPMGIDLTDPEPVRNLTATVNGATPVSGYTPYTRRILVWDRDTYDDLSGAGAFQVKVNGRAITEALCPEPDPAVYWWAAALNLQGADYPDPNFLTVENLPAGKSKIEVVTLDRATNRSTPAVTYAYVDPDVPTVKITVPAVGARPIGVTPTFKATATDLAGIKRVSFYIDGAAKSVDTIAPYQWKANLSGYAHRSIHTLAVVAEDMGGREVSATRTFIVDKVAPTIASVSDSPDPFYPRKREGYKDNSVVKFRLSERANVDLLVYDSAGTLRRQIKKTFDPGYHTITWNGQDSSGSVKAGTYKYRLRATDAVGNTSSTNWSYTHIKTYQIVRLSDSTVRIIPR